MYLYVVRWQLLWFFLLLCFMMYVVRKKILIPMIIVDVYLTRFVARELCVHFDVLAYIWALLLFFFFILVLDSVFKLNVHFQFSISWRELERSLFLNEFLFSLVVSSSSFFNCLRYCTHIETHSGTLCLYCATVFYCKFMWAACK